jgi:hypothetical protein
MASELRMYMAMGALLSFMGMMMFGGTDDKDKKKNAVAEFLSRNMYRMTSRGLLELSFFFDPSAFLRSFMISPVALLSPVKSWQKIYKNTVDELTDSIYGENSPNDASGFGYYFSGELPIVGQGMEFFDFFGTWDYEYEYN